MQESFFEMKYLENEGLFELAWYDRIDGEDDKHKYFSVKLLPETFQQMSYDMLRMVKDFNLKQAIKHQEKENERAIGGAGDCSGCCPSCLNMENGDTQGVRVEGSCEKSSQDHERANGEAKGISQEV